MKFYKNIQKESTIKSYIFNTTYDNSIENESRSNITNKNYIVSQIILNDDTIDTIEKKISTCIEKNNKFSDTYLIPNRLYLWGYTNHNNSSIPTNLGFEWSKDNESYSEYAIIPPIDISQFLNLGKKWIENVYNIMINTIYSPKFKNYQDVILNDYNINNNELFFTDIYNELYSEVNLLYNINDTLLKKFF